MSVLNFDDSFVIAKQSLIQKVGMNEALILQRLHIRLLHASLLLFALTLEDGNTKKWDIRVIMNLPTCTQTILNQTIQLSRE